MSVHDETWDRRVCDYCNKKILYGDTGKHFDGKCIKSKTKVINIKSGQPYDIYIGRAGHGKDGYYGNPHTMGGVYCSACKGYHDRIGAIAAFKKDLDASATHYHATVRFI